MTFELAPPAITRPVRPPPQTRLEPRWLTDGIAIHVKVELPPESPWERIEMRPPRAVDCEGEAAFGGAHDYAPDPNPKRSSHYFGDGVTVYPMKCVHCGLEVLK